MGTLLTETTTMALAETETEGSQNAPHIAERRRSRLQDLGAVEGQNASVAQSPRSDENELRAFARILSQPPKRRRSEIGSGYERLSRLWMLNALYEALLRDQNLGHEPGSRKARTGNLSIDGLRGILKRMREGESLLDDQWNRKNRKTKHNHAEKLDQAKDMYRRTVGRATFREIGEAIGTSESFARDL